DRATFQQRALQALEAIPEAGSVALIQDLPYSGSSSNWNFNVEGRPDPPPGSAPVGQTQSNSPSYFRAAHIPLLGGREFNDHDTAEALPVAIVSDSLARRYFSGESPIGKRIRFGLPRPGNSNPWLTVVGVAGDIRHDPFDKYPRATIYRPYQQAPTRALSLMIRTSRDPNSLASAARSAIWGIDRNLPLYNALPFRKVVHGQA